LLGGLSTTEIARTFLVKTETMAQRLVRGKKKIKQTAIPYTIPEREVFSERLDAVLSVLYLIFNEGYSASSGNKLIRVELCQEAIRLSRILHGLCPDEPEVKALLSLHDARKGARFNGEGDFIALEEQNRSLWDKTQIAEGVSLIEKALQRGNLGSYQIQAVIELNRLVALSYVKPVEYVLKSLNGIENEFDNYQPFYAVKADFLRRANNIKLAIDYYNKAIHLSGNIIEKEFLERRLAEIQS
jgi:RNA polymerase sigma-70 factor, ECF subfamily